MVTETHSTIGNLYFIPSFLFHLSLSVNISLYSTSFEMQKPNLGAYIIANTRTANMRRNGIH